MDKIKEILDELLETHLRTKVEIDSILNKYESLIKSKIKALKKADETSNKNIVKELFTIQNEICIVVYRYSYPANKFITDFVYDFDRQDDISINYIIDKMKKISNSD